MSYEPPIATVQQVYDALGWAIEMGRASQPLMLDRRGLGYLRPERHSRVGLGLSTVEEMFEPHAVSLRVVF